MGCQSVINGLYQREVIIAVLALIILTYCHLNYPNTTILQKPLFNTYKLLAIRLIANLSDTDELYVEYEVYWYIQD